MCTYLFLSYTINYCMWNYCLSADTRSSHEQLSLQSYFQPVENSISLMRTFSFPDNCTRNQIEEFPRTRINISAWRCLPHIRPLASSHNDTVRARDFWNSLPKHRVYRRNPQLTRIEISTLSPFLYNSIPGEVLEGARRPSSCKLEVCTTNIRCAQASRYIQPPRR